MSRSVCLWVATIVVNEQVPSDVKVAVLSPSLLLSGDSPVILSRARRGQDEHIKELSTPFQIQITSFAPKMKIVSILKKKRY